MNTTFASGTPTVLKKIIERKYQEIEQDKKTLSLDDVKAISKDQPECRGFVSAMQAKLDDNDPAIIAEIKKASPSKGVIREDFVPAAIAESYERGGAACLSVLTDVDFFQGHNEYLKQARDAVSIPAIRKDFLVDEYQIAHARVLEADCVLLIAAALTRSQLQDLNGQALELGMDVLVEVHNAEELADALTLPNRLLGINNRNLHTFDVTLQTTFDLLSQVPSDKIVVTESGILTVDDVKLMRQHKVNSFLVGETFMRADEPGEKLHELFFS